MFHREHRHDDGFVPRLHTRVADREGFAVNNASDEPRTLYVGNLDPAVTDDFLSTFFNHVGVVTKTKIIYDLKTFTDPYAFIEFRDHHDAVKTMKALQRKELLGKEMRINWAADQQHHGEQRKQDSRHFHVFVGDLSTEVDNQKLREAFSPFGEVSDAKVIRDTQTNKSKGYGFVSFPKRDDAERAIEQMNGQWLGRRTIRTNWASRKPGDGQHERERQERQERIWEAKFEELMTQSAPDNTSVYVGNISVLNDDDIRGAFDRFGRIIEVRLFKTSGYAFVKFEQKEPAARAIAQMNNQEIKGVQIRCSWGKAGSGSSNNSSQENSFQEQPDEECGSGSGSGTLETIQPQVRRYRSQTPAARTPPRDDDDDVQLERRFRSRTPCAKMTARSRRYAEERGKVLASLGSGMVSAETYAEVYVEAHEKTMLRLRRDAESIGGRGCGSGSGFDAEGRGKVLGSLGSGLVSAEADEKTLLRLRRDAESFGLRGGGSGFDAEGRGKVLGSLRGVTLSAETYAEAEAREKTMLQLRRNAESFRGLGCGTGAAGSGMILASIGGGMVSAETHAEAETHEKTMLQLRRDAERGNSVGLECGSGSGMGAEGRGKTLSSLGDGTLSAEAYAGTHEKTMLKLRRDAERGNSVGIECGSGSGMGTETRGKPKKTGLGAKSDFEFGCGTPSASPSALPSALPSASKNEDLELAIRHAAPILENPQIRENWRTYWARCRAETDAEKRLPRVPPWITERKARNTYAVRAKRADAHEQANERHYGAGRPVVFDLSSLKQRVE